jgi:hypothetical protein
MEEKWFFLYHMKLDTRQSMQLPINERKWFIERFIKQKERENQAIEAAKRKSKIKK